MKTSLLKKFYLLSALMATYGCTGQTEAKQRGIVGIVVTEDNIDQSYIQTTIYKELYEKRIRDAKVYLAFDKEGKELIEGCEAASDAEGNYRIDTSSIPPPKDRYGDYFLVAHKPGYERFVLQITLGPYSRYQRNTIILKQHAKDENQVDVKKK